MIAFITEIIKSVIAVGIIIALILAALILIRDQTKRTSSLRLIIQIVFLCLIFAGLIIGPFGVSANMGIAPRDTLVGTNFFGFSYPDGLSVPVLACYYPNGRTVTCPIWQIQTYIFPFWNSGGGWEVYYYKTGLERLAAVLGMVGVMSFFLGRFFCGWICPFGLYMDLLTRLRKTLNIKHLNLSKKSSVYLSQSRYLILVVLVILSSVFASQAIFGLQVVPGTERGGYIYDYFSAPFCQICPMRPLSVIVESIIGFMSSDYVFSRTTGLFYEAGYYITSLNIAILVLISAGSFMIRRLWCRMCPLGGLIAIFSRFEPFKRLSPLKLTKIEEKCTKCGICKRVCPTEVTEVYEKKGGDVTTSDCILCFRCVEMCPYEGCLNVQIVGKQIYTSRNWLEKPR